MALPFSLLTSSWLMSPGELAREWIVKPMAPTGELELISTKGSDWVSLGALSAGGMLAVGNGLCGIDEPLPSNKVSEVDPGRHAASPSSLTLNLTRFALLRMPAFLCLP